MAKNKEKSFLEKLFPRPFAVEDGVTAKELADIGINTRTIDLKKGLSFTDLTRAQQQRILQLRGQ